MKQPLARKEGLIIQELPDEVLVYDSTNDRAHCLNNTAALVWKYCDGKREVADIAKIIEKEFGAPVREEFVWLALDQLEKEALLEQENAFSLKTMGVSRREVIKRIGLASVVALPIVTSLLNPMSAKAGLCNQSCTPTNIPINCNAGNQCLAACNSAGTTCRPT